MPPVAYESDARLALKSKGLTVTEISKTLSIRKQRVSEWLSGARKPEENNRLLISQAFGIAPALWDRLTPADADPTPDSPQASENSFPVFDHRINNLETVRADIKRLETALASGVPSNVLGTISNSLRNYRELEADLLVRLEDTEQGWAKTASFLDLVDRVYAALKPYPEALAAVVEVFEIS